MIVFQMFLLIGVASLIYVSQKSKLSGDKKMTILFFTILSASLFYGTSYILDLEIPSIANTMTAIVKSLQGVET